MPRVTVLIPTYQSAGFISEAIDSVLTQSYGDYEILIVDDDSTDATVDILNGYRDGRIRVIRGPGEGLAAALNRGITQARGEYIARLDSDDLMAPGRLEKQVRYMDGHPEVLVCGGWQQYFGQSSFLHAPPAGPEQCRANLLFRCDLCHSTLMMRRSAFLENRLFYDGRYAAEDFELWTRALDHGDIANIPEVMGYFRASGENITDRKKGRLIYEQGQIVAKTLCRNLGIRLTERQTLYFIGWVNPFFDPRYGIDPKERREAWEDLREVLLGIYRRNLAVGYYDNNALLRAIYAEWGELRYGESFTVPEKEITPDNLFEKRNPVGIFIRRLRGFLKNNRSLKSKIAKIRSKLKGYKKPSGLGINQ